MLARRSALAGLAGVPLATLLADARLARAAAAGLETATIQTVSGRTVQAALAHPEAKPAPAVVLVHEWWGLNDQIKSVAAALADAGYLALAVDLYEGQVAATPDTAKALMSAVDPAAATDTLASWIDWLAGHPEATGRVATLGWCFGGGWSLNAALARPVPATVVYYGNVAKSAADLAPLEGPVLGHFATQDQWINQAMVDGFAAAMAAAGKQTEIHWYDADHAFANPTQGRYDEADAALAWRRTLEFLARHLSSA
ncbi:MAG: dienelactone hydrolase family protein [Alphaproteobacteria bacterium]